MNANPAETKDQGPGTKGPAKKKKPRARDQIVGAVIRCLVNRNALLKPCGEWESRAAFEQNQRYNSRMLAEAQLELERLMVRRMKLDHLDDVDRVYGIKRRVVNYQTGKTVAAAVAA